MFEIVDEIIELVAKSGKLKIRIDDNGLWYNVWANGVISCPLFARNIRELEPAIQRHIRDLVELALSSLRPTDPKPTD